MATGPQPHRVSYLPACVPSPPQVISQKEGDFFFDSLRHVSDWVKKNKPQKEGEGLRWGWAGWDGGRGWGHLPSQHFRMALGSSFTDPFPCMPLDTEVAVVYKALPQGEVQEHSWGRWPPRCS